MRRRHGSTSTLYQTSVSYGCDHAHQRTKTHPTNTNAYRKTTTAPMARSPASCAFQRRTNAHERTARRKWCSTAKDSAGVLHCGRYGFLLDGRDNCRDSNVDHRSRKANRNVGKDRPSVHWEVVAAEARRMEERCEFEGLHELPVIEEEREVSWGCMRRQTSDQRGLWRRTAHW